MSADWKPHYGGSMPEELKDYCTVAVQWRDGSEWKGQPHGFQWAANASREPQPFDIIGYIPLKAKHAPIPPDPHSWIPTQ